MRILAYILILLGLIWALYSTLLSPAMYPLSQASAPQAAQIFSDAARGGVGGVAIMLFGVALLVDSTRKREG